MSEGHPTTDRQTLKERWLEALRSGKYQQAKNFLRRDETHFCCLGVLCDVVDSSRWEPLEAGPGYKHTHGHHGAIRYLPDWIARQGGFNEEVLDKAMSMNDKGKSFADIANFLEINL